MYLRKSTRKYKDKTYTSYLLVESVSTPKGPRQKTICSLGDLSPKPREQWLHIARACTQHSPASTPCSTSPPKWSNCSTPPGPGRNACLIARCPAPPLDPSHHPRRPRAGRGGIGARSGHRSRRADILEAHGIRCGAAIGRAQRAHPVLTCAMVMNRLIAPASEHAMPAWMRRTALGELLGADFATLSEAALYRNMDRLHPKRALIESDLVERERELFNLDQTIFFYDLTSTYFEGQALNNPSANAATRATSAPTASRWWSVSSSTATAFPRRTKSSTATPRTAPACRPCSTHSKRAWGAFAAGRWWSSTAAWRSTRTSSSCVRGGCATWSRAVRANAPAGSRSSRTSRASTKSFASPRHAIPDRKRPRSKSSSSAPRRKPSSCASAKGESKRTAPSATSTSGVY